MFDWHLRAAGLSLTLFTTLFALFLQVFGMMMQL